MPKPVRIARYIRPVAAITAEYDFSFRAYQVAITRPRVVIEATIHIHPIRPL